MSSKEHSRRDIAKQFELPERKSKIATLLKESDVYCICRSTDSTRFMIACDNCEEWYHGDCINITEPESRAIKQYFCPPCREQNSTLKIGYKKQRPVSNPEKERTKIQYDRKPGRPKKVSSDYPRSSMVDEASAQVAGCGSCSGCLTVVDCGRCDHCKKNQKYGGRSRRQCRKRECVDQSDIEARPEIKQETTQVLAERQIDGTDEEEDWQPSPSKAKKQKMTPSPSKRGRKQQRKVLKEAKDKLSRRKTKNQRQLSHSGSTDKEDSDAVEESIQCYGLDCNNAAKKGSKYCSDDCGVKLATERLYRVLPGRIQEWNLTPCTAEEHNKRDLEDIRRKQLETRTALTDLERKRSELDHHVLYVQQLKVDPDLEEEEPEEDCIIHCITCGHEISAKNCLKHMERCYNKYESQTSFGSIYKTKLEGIPIFCDVFNPINGTYCKRLQVLCPEHTKEPKIRDSEVCGCPLVKELFQPSKEICRLPKKKCNKHFCWEKLRRAEVDMERVRHWLKLDELLEQERQLRSAMTNRAGVMGLLLHSTFDHELRSRIQHQIQEGNLQKEQKQQTAVKIKQETQTRAPESSKSKLQYFETPQNDIVGQPLIKKRDKDRRRSSTEVMNQDKKEEVTASKLYKRMISNSQD